MLNLNEDEQRFYSTIAVTDTFCVSLSRKNMRAIVDLHEKRLMTDRRDFMIGIEEFKEISKTVLKKITEEFEVITCIRGKTIVTEG